MVHLRKNVSFTAPWPAGLVITDQELSALLVRCRANLSDGTPVHFHLQITASAVPAGATGGGRSDSLLFQSVPDLDDIRIFSQTAPKQVDVSIRAVGEMVPNLGINSVAMTVPTDNDEYGVPRVTVNVVTRGTPYSSLSVGTVIATELIPRFGTISPTARIETSTCLGAVWEKIRMSSRSGTLWNNRESDRPPPVAPAGTAEAVICRWKCTGVPSDRLARHRTSRADNS